MRLWSAHPEYLDSKGLVALWREALLAKKVLEGGTTGYRKHPQLIRFRRHEAPLDAIHAYLAETLREADSRGYAFDRSKCEPRGAAKIPLTRGQLEYEFHHLLEKLRKRDPERYEKLKATESRKIKAHPLFDVVEGAVEEWEKGAAGRLQFSDGLL